VHAAEVAFDRARDTQILAAAAAEGRIVVTADLDYPRLLALVAADKPSLVLFRGGDWSDAEVIARMNTLLTSVQDEDLTATILVVERGRVRKRRLPIL